MLGDSWEAGMLDSCNVEDSPTEWRIVPVTCNLTAGEKNANP